MVLIVGLCRLGHGRVVVALNRSSIASTTMCRTRGGHRGSRPYHFDDMTQCRTPLFTFNQIAPETFGLSNHFSVQNQEEIQSWVGDLGARSYM